VQSPLPIKERKKKFSFENQTQFQITCTSVNG
jgi:hypothetical protein